MRLQRLLALGLAAGLLLPSVLHGQRQSDVDDINRLIDQYGAFEDAMDMTGQAELMSGDRVWIAQAFGRRTDQAQNMAIQQATFDALLEQVPEIRTSTEDRDRLIRFHGNGTVAIASFFRYTTASLPPDAPPEVVSAWTAIPATVVTMVLEKQGSEWKIVHTHFSDLGPPAGG